MAAGRSVSYELYYLQHGRWSIHARYSYHERDTAIEEAKSLDKQGHVEATCVVRESFDYSTNRSSESVIYHSPSLKTKPPVSFITSGAASGERRKPAGPPQGSAAANAADNAKTRGAKTGGAKTGGARKAAARKGDGRSAPAAASTPAGAASDPPVPHPPLPDPPSGPPERDVVGEGDYSAILPKLIFAFVIASVVATVSATLLFYLIKVIVKLGIAVDPGLGQGILIGSWALIWGGIFIPMTKRAFDLVKIENRRFQRARLRRQAEQHAAEEAAAKVLAGEGDDANESGASRDGAGVEDIGPSDADIVYSAVPDGKDPDREASGAGTRDADGSPSDSPASSTHAKATSATATAEPAGVGPAGVGPAGVGPNGMRSAIAPMKGGAPGTGGTVGETAQRRKARADSKELSNDPNAVEPISGGTDGLRDELQVLADEAREILGGALDNDAFARFGVILFLSGAGETLARRCRVGQAEMRTTLAEIVQGFSVPESQARGFTHNVDEYLLDRRYFAMYSAGREGAMRPGRDDPSGLRQALDDWKNAARQRALRAAGGVADGDPRNVNQAGANEPSQSFVAVMFTDIVDSTTRQQEFGDAWMMNVVRAHNEIVREVLKKYSGREIKHTGDGIMASFAVVANAVEAALAMQAGFEKFSERMPDYAFTVRIGLSAGEPIHESGDIFGTPVNLAARVLSHAGDGDTAVSAIAREMCRGKGLQFEEIGRFELKGFDEPQPIYRTTDRRTLSIDLERGAIDRVVKDVEAADASIDGLPRTNEAGGANSHDTGVEGDGRADAPNAAASDAATRSAAVPNAAAVVPRSVPGESEPPSLARTPSNGTGAAPPEQRVVKKAAGRKTRPAPGTVRKVAAQPKPPRVPRSPGPVRDEHAAESEQAELEGESLSSTPARPGVTRIGGGQSDG